jgi:site-specific DNA-methyltransferase (adenine-specific)
MKYELNEFYNEDCLEAMKSIPDKYFDLAIVDPPYGIGAGSVKFINGTSKSEKPYYRQSDWDTKPPSKEYFDELKRVSKNQIIWGGNYFAEHLGNFRCFIFWDKTIHGNSYADGELAWTSFDKVARYYRKNIVEVTRDGRIHPTQKPVSLYAWILNNYAKEGDKILDTHVGSASSLIACHELGYDFIGFELDKDYYKQANERLERSKNQLKLF